MSSLSNDPLLKLFGYWREVAEETYRVLGDETAGLFVYLHNDASDVLGAIADACPEGERQRSLVHVEFTGLFKELLHLHAMFLCGNYPFVLRTLRFNWERIFRAFYADTYAEEHSDDPHMPGESLEEKHQWLTKREEKLNWRTVIAPILRRLFSGDVEPYFKRTWDKLNSCVHPSGELREKLMGESWLHAVEAFDEDWARETHADAVQVMSLIWLAILYCFPEAAPALKSDPHTFEKCPQLRAVLTDV